MENLFKKDVLFFHENNKVNKFMSMADLDDRGLKVFGSWVKMELALNRTWGKADVNKFVKATQEALLKECRTLKYMKIDGKEVFNSKDFSMLSDGQEWILINNPENVKKKEIPND